MKVYPVLLLIFGIVFIVFCPTLLQIALYAVSGEPARTALVLFGFFPPLIIGLAIIVYAVELILGRRGKGAKERALAKFRRKQEAKGEALCEHLRLIGLKATWELEEEHSRRFGRLFVYPIARIVDRNIHFVEWDEWVGYGGADVGDVAIYGCSYVVLTNVEGLEDKLTVEGAPVRESFWSRHVVDFKWDGKRQELAQLLNGDAELKGHLLSERRPPRCVYIVPFAGMRTYQFVRIGQSGGTLYRAYYKAREGYNRRVQTFGMFPIPTAESFEAYDRIAQHVRSIASVHP